MGSPGQGERGHGGEQEATGAGPGCGWEEGATGAQVR